MLRNIVFPLAALALGILIGVTFPAHPRSDAAGTCDAADGSTVALGAVENGAICTNLVPGGWAVAAPQEVSDEDR